MSEILPDEQLPVLVSDRWEMPKRVENIYVMTDEKSGCPLISFIAPDSFSEYHILRIGKNNEATEVCVVEGSAGSYVSVVDESAPDGDALYCVVSRHKGFMQLGRVVESQPSESVEYHAPVLLERLLKRSHTQPQSSAKPLFGKTD
jgi:hypothetical protein